MLQGKMTMSMYFRNIQRSPLPADMAVIQRQKSGAVKRANMELSLLLTLFTLLATVERMEVIAIDSVITFDVLYNAGIESYADERWSNCARYMKKALEDFKFYQNNLVACKVKCEFSTKTPSGDPSRFLELSFFEISVKRSDCLRRCREELLPGRPDTTSQKAVEEFETFSVYDYLQICAYKSQDFETAAAASFTYLLLHPEHQPMKDNVKYYRTLPEVQNEFFKNLQLKKYQELYMQGVDAYGQQEYTETVQYLEGALTEYYEEYRRCTLLCEAPYDHQSWPDFYNAIADHWLSVLRCKQKCQDKLAHINGAMVEDYLAEHYNYLQFSYYKVKNIQEAAACAATYLLFKPDSEVMQQNQLFYESQGLAKEDFIPRVNAKDYLDAGLLEAEMLQFARSRYKYSDADEDDGRFDTDKPSGPEGTDALSRPQSVLDYFSYEHRDARAYGPRDEAHQEALQTYLMQNGYTLVKEEAELAGSNRFVVDGLLNQEQCHTLRTLAGHGFSGPVPESVSQRTLTEKYDGLQSTEAAQLAKNETIKSDVAQLFFDAADSVIRTTEKYFNTKWPVFIDFKHVVCKKPSLNPDGEPRSEFNQPFQTDNCIVGQNGTCVRKPPASWWREYTSFLYLNDDFEGGEFAFGDSNDVVTAKVKPKCGRLLTFNASDYHSVLSYTGGPRCVLGVWSTMDPEYKSTKVTEARAVINSARKREEISVLKDFTQEHQIDLVMTEAELNGPERFAADNVIDEETCKALIHLANVGGVAGDGYTSTTLTSVDTENERFAGLTISAAAQLAANKVIEADLVKLYMDKSILAKDMTAKYFDLDRPLYFDYTHLVCRTSIHDKDKVRTDLSHPVHSDNCLIQPDNSCKKAPPAYIQRDYSALLYLNDNFTGGDFFFTHQNMTVQSKVRPKCGRMVGFNAGNYHGVEAVTSGQRCALAGWFTLDKRFDEAAYGIARNILKDLDGKPLGPPLDTHSHKEL